MKPIYRDKSRRALIRQAQCGTQLSARSKSTCPSLHLGPLRAALFAAVGLSQLGCPDQQEIIARGERESAGVSASEVAGTSAGEVAGTIAGEVAGTSAGEVAGTIAGEVAGDIAGSFVIDCERRPDVNREGEPNGYEICDNRRAFRVGPATCTLPQATNTEACVADYSSCTVDSDCVEGPNGRCQAQAVEGPIDETFCGCQYFCESDADCDAGLVCDCVAGALGVCRVANCTESADCASGVCEYSLYTDGCESFRGFFCHSEADQCSVNNDCLSGMSYCSVAPWSEDESRACHDFDSCAIGRPAIVDGEQLCAHLEMRDGWGEVNSELCDLLNELTSAERALLTEHWSTVAALEHSSVASFARVTLELMGLGAPSELLLETQRAAADEVEHAREVYGLLSSLSGQPMGPSEFPVSALAPRLDHREITLSVAREACLGETLGVAEVEGALMLARAQSGPREVIEHLERVATDETRHAALAWRTLAWLLEDASSSLLDEVARVFLSGADHLLSSIEDSTDELSRRPDEDAMSQPIMTRLSRLGVLTPTQRRAYHLAGLSEVLIPCARELLGSARIAPLERLARQLNVA